MACCWPARKTSETKRSKKKDSEELKNMATGRSMRFEKRLVHRLSGHEGSVLYCAVDPKGKTLATCSVDGNINLWTIATGEMVRTLKEGHTADVTSCAFSTIGTILASSSRDKKVILWRYDTGKRASRLELHSDAVLHCSFSKDGKLLASASKDMTARLYKIRPGAGEFVPGGDIKLLAGHTGAVNVVQFSPDAGVVITGSDDKTVRVWGKESNWDCIKTITEFHSGVKSVMFSPIDPMLATMSANRVTLWAINGYKYQPENRVDMKGGGKQLKAIAFIPDGRYIVGVASDASVNIWDSLSEKSWQTWKDSERTNVNTHEGAILSCCFSGNNFFSADANGFTFIWELV